MAHDSYCVIMFCSAGYAESGGNADMEERIRDELSVIRDMIVNTVPVRRMFLFGSHAYGTPDAESDLDIYVVLADDADIREIDAMKLIRRSIRDRKTMPVDVVVSKENVFNQRISAPTIERQFVQEGVVLYG
jgi:predicted nucleotidyltransferase